MDELKSILGYIIRIIDIYDSKVSELTLEKNPPDILCTPDLGNMSQYKIDSDKMKFAYDKGYVMGVDENNFGTGSLITREQMAVIIARCLNLKAEKELSCNDADKISDYAKDAVAALGEKGIMNGDDTGAFNPKNNATRAETAKVIYELTKLV